MEKKALAPPQALFFDMDGTLLIETEAASQSWLLVFEQFAQRLDLPAHALYRTLNEIYRSYKQDIAHDPEKQRRDRLDPFAVRKEQVQAVLAHFGIPSSTLASDLVHAYEERREQCRHLAPHAKETLSRLRDQQIPLALLTNGNASYQRRKIARHDLVSFFDAIFIEEEFGNAKSDPRIYRAALDQLHTPAQRAWMVGDDLTFDIAVPGELGIVTIWLDSFRKGLPAETIIRPQRIIHTLKELFLWEEREAPALF